MSIALLKFPICIVLFLIICVMIIAFYLIYFQHNNFNTRINFTLKHIKNLPIPICIIDVTKNRIIDCNSFMLKFFDKTNLININLSESLLFENYNDYLNIKKIASHTPKNITLDMKIKNEIKKINIKFSQINTLNKKYLILIFEDKTANDKYIKKLGVFSAIINQSPDGIIISRYIDKNNYPIIEYCNSSIETITGYTKEEIINKPLNVLFNLNVDEKTLKNLFNSIHSYEKSSLEYQYTKKTGEICWAQTDIIPINTNIIEKSLIEIDDDDIDINNSIDENNLNLYITIHQKDITDIKLSEYTSKEYIKALKRALKTKTFYIKTMLKGLLIIINKFNISNFENILNETLKTIALTLEVDRAYLFLVENENDQKIFNMKAEWVNKNISPQINNPLTNRFIVEELGAYDLYVNLISNKRYAMSIEDIKEPRFNYNLIIKDIKSIIIYPIFYNKKLIGFIGLDDCNVENRVWDELIDETLLHLSKGLSEFIYNNFLKNS